MDVTDFVDRFHSLCGQTLGEKKKNFNLLFKSTSLNHDEVIASITPENELESLFRLKLLLKLQRFPDLIEIFRNGNEYLSTKLLKNRWFCQSLAATLDERSSGFVNEVLPFTSYVTRKRIISKLAIYGSKLDTVYDDITARYGISIASNLIVGCTVGKIEKEFQSQEIWLAPLYQKVLYKKHPDLFMIYAEQGKYTINDSVVHHIARTDINKFLKLVEVSNNTNSVGKRLTKKLLIGFKEHIITNSKSFAIFLHLKTVIKFLTEEDLRRFYLNCYPSKMSFKHYNSFSQAYINLTGKLGGKKNYKLLFYAMQEKEKKSLYDCPSLVTDEMMKDMDGEERQKWVFLKKKSGTSEDDLIPFMKLTESIQLIKSKINVTSSIKGREDLILKLIETCQVNNDIDVLAEVAEYVCTRHRNDDDIILRTFVYEVGRLFPLEKLQERHWKSINSILAIVGRQSLPLNYVTCGFYDMFFKYIEFLYRQSKLTNEDLVNFIKAVYGSHKWWDQTRPEELKKTVLLKIIKMLPTIIQKDDKVEYVDLDLIRYIFDWNDKHPDNQILIFDYPRLIESFMKLTKDAIEIDEYNSRLISIKTLYKRIICNKEESEFRNETLRNYFLLGFRYYSSKIDNWLLKHQPNLIVANSDKFLPHIIERAVPNVQLLHCVKKYTDSSFHKLIINRCLESINENKCFELLAILEPPVKYLEHIAPFYPPNNKIEECEKGNQAIRIARSFKYTSTSLVLPTLITYCKGDFLGQSLESLYYLFYHLPENHLSAFINELSAKAVSVRKHSIFLTCIIGSTSDVYKLLTKFIQNEQNVSVQKHLFTAGLRYFKRNPSDEFWECVKICMMKLDKNDNESFRMLVNVHHMPVEYRARHIVFVWQIFKNDDLRKNQSRVLSCIPESTFKNLPLGFLLEVISDNFLVSGSPCETECSNFVIKSLAESDHKSEILKIVSQALKREHNMIKTKSLEDELHMRRRLSTFIAHLVDDIGISKGDFGTLCNLSETWHGLFKPSDAIEEHLRLSFALLYLQLDRDLMKFANAIAEFFQDFVTTFSLVIVDTFASVLTDCLKNFLSCYLEPNVDMFTFYWGLVSRDTTALHLLVVKSLPKRKPSEDKAEELYFKIVDFLRKVDDETVQMVTNIYIMELE